VNGTADHWVMPASDALPTKPWQTSAGRAYPIPSNERGRVASLRLLQVLDGRQTLQLDGLTRLAAFICDTPAAVVNLIDAEEQQPIAPHGFDASPVARSDSMCAISIMSPSVSYTSDASKDERWSQNPFVTGALDEIRTYIASPLVLASGHTIGTLCAFSREINSISPIQLERMQDLAEVTVRMLQMHDHPSRLSHGGTRDPLTELPNQALFRESLDLAIARHARREASVAILFVDLDGFKTVDQTHGPGSGDELLKAVADRLLRCVRASDLVARLAGGEFMVLCTAPLKAGEGLRIDTVINRIRTAFAVPFELGDGPVDAEVSIGPAYLGLDGNDAETLITHADHALYADKRRRSAGK
jgi:diguanylate cyclase (GGDEF)-like protein